MKFDFAIRTGLLFLTALLANGPAVARTHDVRDIILREAGLSERLIVDAQSRPGRVRGAGSENLRDELVVHQDHRLGRGGSNVDSCRDQHDPLSL